MGIGPEEAKALSLEEYQARLHHWNEAHSTDVSPPDPALTMKLIDRINADPKLHS